MLQRTHAPLWQHPAVAWGLVLGTAFVTESLVMLALPVFLPEPRPRMLEALVDAVALTAVIAPVVWWTVVRPTQEVNRLRTHFLTDLFARVEADRRRTALELHDGIGQSLSVLVSGLRSAKAAPGAVPVHVESLLEVAKGALHDVKRLARGLRPSLLDDLGLVPALERLMTDIKDNHSIELTLDVADLGDDRLPEAVETAIFRITQEALANVVAHSQAKAASVAVRRVGPNAVVTITDNGRGLAGMPERARAAGHLGLTGMQERATLLGGTFAVTGRVGGGTSVEATIPLGNR